MNILFVAPPFPGRISEYLILPSLEFCICSAILKSRNHNVQLLDMKIDYISIDEVDKALLLFEKPGIVYIDDSPEVHCNSKKLIERIKNVYGPQTYIAMRGEICSFEPEMVMTRNPALDFIIRYDDDYAFPDLVEMLAINKKDFSAIHNLVYRNNKEIIIPDEVKRKYDLNSLPMPDRKLYNIAKYLERDSETIVRSTRGCPGRCLFCIKTRYEQFGVFSVSRFVDEIVELQKFGFESFFFSDDTFAFSDERLREFANEIRRRNLKIRFTSNIRIKDINDYKISTLKEIGAYRVFVGIETVNSKSSVIINKNLKLQEIKEKIEILHKYGMEFHASFILGAPNDTEEDLEETIRFVNEIRPTVVTFNMIKAYPGLPIYTNPEKYGIIMDDPYWFEKDTWSHKCVIGTQNLPPQTIEKWSRRMLFEFIGA